MYEPVRLITTGGTIDEDHSDSEGRSVFAGTKISKMLEETGQSHGVVIDALMQKESLDITDKDRELILEQCASAPENRIVITHGTNTMVETATLLGRNISDKTVVLVGAFIPYVKRGSDAAQNLKYALQNVRQLPYGVYVVMNGQVFNWNNVRKNKEKQVFERAQ